MPGPATEAIDERCRQLVPARAAGSAVRRARRRTAGRGAPVRPDADAARQGLPGDAGRSRPRGSRRGPRRPQQRAGGARPLHRTPAVRGGRRRLRRPGLVPRHRRRDARRSSGAGGRYPGRVRGPRAGKMEAVVPGHRLRPLHELHAVPELLPLRRLRRLEGRADPGPEPRQLQDRLPGLLAGFARRSRSCSPSTATGRSTAARFRPTTCAAKR